MNIAYSNAPARLVLNRLQGHLRKSQFFFGDALGALCDIDFKAASRDGFGEDWPVDYRNRSVVLQAEKYMGVASNHSESPQHPDG